MNAVWFECWEVEHRKAIWKCATSHHFQQLLLKIRAAYDLMSQLLLELKVVALEVI
jgi:hypothetical protein